MLNTTLIQSGLFAVETLFIGAILLLFFRLRSRFGLALLYVTLGGFQSLQSALASSLSIELFPGVFVSPGSTILFSALLFTLLLVYIREDAAETRALLYGILVANVTIGLLLYLLNFHADITGMATTSGFDPQQLISSQRIFMAGTAVLALDAVLLIVAFELFSKLLPNTAFLRVFLTLTTVLAFDTFAFGIAAFYPSEHLREIVISGLVGKTMASVLLSILLAIYLRTFDKPEDHSGPIAAQLRGVIGLMSYRQKYAALRERFTRDSLTELYNRGFFDTNLQLEVARAARLQQATSLMMVDLDHFKKINDSYGHTTGDSVIRLLADAMRACFRKSDLCCRFGGEEFAAIMPDTDKSSAIMIANRLNRIFAELLTDARPQLEIDPVTMTIGVATFPDDGNDGFSLLEIADQRLYLGKRGGRDCVVATNTSERCRRE